MCMPGGSKVDILVPIHLVTKPDRYIFMLEHQESIYTSLSLLGTDFALDLVSRPPSLVPRPYEGK